MERGRVFSPAVVVEDVNRGHRWPVPESFQRWSVGVTMDDVRSAADGLGVIRDRDPCSAQLVSDVSSGGAMEDRNMALAFELERQIADVGDGARYRPQFEVCYEDTEHQFSLEESGPIVPVLGSLLGTARNV